MEETQKRKEMIGKIVAYLGGLTTITLATVDESGAPCAASAYFAGDERLNLYFLSDRKTLHGTNMLRDPRVAVTAHGEHQEWKELKGLQLRGEARPVTLTEFPTAAACYVKKFPFAAAGIGAADLSKAIKAATVWVFRPSWGRYIDNAVSFGFKEEFEM